VNSPYTWNAELTQSALYIALFCREKGLEVRKSKKEKYYNLRTPAASSAYYCIFSPFSGAFYAVSAIAVLAYKYILFGKL
jgi:hypothetical protein